MQFSSQQTAAPSLALEFPIELLQVIFGYVPRSSLAQISVVSRQWNIVASPLLYKHVYIRTLYHWKKFVSSCSENIKNNTTTTRNPWPAISVTSLVLRPSPKLLPRISRLQTVRGLPTDSEVEKQGYIRTQPVDLDNTGLERLLTTDDDNYGIDNRNGIDMEVDTTRKEAEWLTKVTDMDMAKVIAQCPQLVYLQASGCTQIGDATMYALASASSQTSSTTAFSDVSRGRAGGMQGLWLDQTRQISSVAWMTFVHAEQKRQSATTVPSGSATVRNRGSTFDHNQQLQYLDLSYCGFVTDTCLINSLPIWTKNLTHLRLCSLYNITDETVIVIAKYCLHLRLLHLSRCFKITNQSLVRLASSPLIITLIHLSLAYLNQVNEEGIKHLIFACQHLQSLDISGTGINPMFKQLIIQQWDQWREQKQWGRIQFQEESVLLL
ncbi:hypothetical protein BC941DRAFT_446872 [Chlamydoabsidia padenii]|nr:hypothetical protein BC941DRAFT_446872 [Chlamydoabsidia padenii]